MEKVQVRSQLELESLGVAKDELQTHQVQGSATESTGDRTAGAHWVKGAARKAVLFAVIVVVWVLLGIPTLMFYLPQVWIL